MRFLNLKLVLIVFLFLVHDQAYLMEKKLPFIRAQCITGNPKYWKSFLTLKPCLKKCGLIFVDSQPDVILFDSKVEEMI